MKGFSFVMMFGVVKDVVAYDANEMPRISGDRGFILVGALFTDRATNALI